ncbi:MAG: Rrf2 family transcriptional regulator, partial [Thioalkalivibrio sp.]|nr:Rrf2 family transcriptional regulator [Thioalkalivibrio sp.]
LTELHRDPDRLTRARGDAEEGTTEAVEQLLEWLRLRLRDRAAEQGGQPVAPEIFLMDLVEQCAAPFLIRPVLLGLDEAGWERLAEERMRTVPDRLLSSLASDCSVSAPIPGLIPVSLAARPEFPIRVVLAFPRFLSEYRENDRGDNLAFLSGTAVYALRAMLYLATQEGEGPVSVESIGRNLGVPQNYLSKVLHALAKEGLLRSLRGPGGGYELASPASSMSLIDVIRPFDPVGSPPSCLLCRDECSEKKPCMVHGQWTAVAADVTAFFRDTTLLEVVSDASKADLT